MADKYVEAPPPEYAGGIKPQARKLHDPDVTLEEYHFYARQTREAEKLYTSPKIRLRQIFSNKKESTNVNGGEATVEAKDYHSDVNFANPEARARISDEEWENASRAFRTASWGAVFYLITTDILGPYSIGFAMGTLGWGPGIGLFTLFGAMVAYSGYLVWRTFLGVDSYQFPCRNYGDLAFRTCGSTLRHITNFIQALALLLILGQVTIQFGQNISQMSKFRLCYIVCPLIFVIAGFFMTQIRTLKNYGLVANLAIWLNILVIILTMGFIAHSPPNYAASTLGSAGSAVDRTTITPDAQGNYPPIIHYNSLPSDGLVGSINGLLAGVLAYAGVQLYVEFLAEMRRPTDFIKAMAIAQVFIYVVYLVYGSFVYFYQGQYSYSPAYQGVSKYSWQTVGNAISLVAALIAGGLYGNIGIKVFYNNVLMDLFNAPPLITRSGKILYAAIVPIWWSTAFIVAAAIPDYFGFVSVISASTLIPLSYSLPPLYALGFDIQKNAIRASAGEGFDGTTGQVVRNDSGLKRLIRGFLSGGPFQVAINIWHVLYFLASMGMCGLGMYAAIDGMIEAFKIPQLTSFSCTSPLDLSAQ